MSHSKKIQFYRNNTVVRPDTQNNKTAFTVAKESFDNIENISDGEVVLVRYQEGEEDEIKSITGVYHLSGNSGSWTFLSENYPKMYMGTCSTTASALAKVATVEKFPVDELGKPLVGTLIGVKYTVSNTYKTSGNYHTLNVNNTGAYRMYYNNAELATSTSANTLVAGYKNRNVFYVFNGTNWVWLGASYDNNTTYSNASLGQGYATQSNESAATAITATLGSYALTTGGIVAVKFTYDVPSDATLNVNSKGAKAIYFKGSAITNGIIKAGDTATFIYSTNYHLISIDRWDDDIKAKVNSTDLSAVATSGSYNDLSDTPTIPDISGKADKALVGTLTAQYDANDELTGYTCNKTYSQLTTAFDDGTYVLLHEGNEYNCYLYVHEKTADAITFYSQTTTDMEQLKITISSSDVVSYEQSPIVWSCGDY